MRDAEGDARAVRAGRPEGTLDSGELARFYGSVLGQGRRIAKATILAQAEHFDMVVRNKTASGFTLATTLNRTARWALVSEAEEAARPARAPVEAPAPSVAVEPRRRPPQLSRAAIAAVLAPVPAAAPRTEELFAYVREVYVRAAQQGAANGERLAALRAAGRRDGRRSPKHTGATGARGLHADAARGPTRRGNPAATAARGRLG